MNAAFKCIHLEQPRDEGAVEPITVLLVALCRRLVGQEGLLLTIDFVFAGVEVGGEGLDANCLMVPLEAKDHARLGQYVRMNREIQINLHKE